MFIFLNTLVEWGGGGGAETPQSLSYAMLEIVSLTVISDSFVLMWMLEPLE